MALSDSSNVERLYKRIKHELKAFESVFQEKHGRAPNKKDIAALPHMGECSFTFASPHTEVSISKITIRVASSICSFAVPRIQGDPGEA